MITKDISTADEVDQALSSGRFGNGKALAHNIRILYTGVKRILDASIGYNLTAVMSSPSAAVQVVARATIDEAFAMLTSNLEGAKQKVAELKRYSTSLADGQNESNTHSFPEQDLQPLSNWTSSDLHQTIIRRMRDTMSRDGYTGKMKPVETTESHRKAIENAKALLNQLTPRVASSTLLLVRCLALIDATIDSGYINETPFMFMVNVARLADPLQTADIILHEALHQKQVDIRLTRQLLHEGYDDVASEASVDVPIPWGASSPRPFSVARGLAAYHVYVHTTLLHTAALEHLPNNPVLHSIGGEEIVRRLATTFERAAYLDKSLRSDIARAKMSNDASQFMAWMGHALDQLRDVRLLDGTRLGDRQPSFSSNVA